MRAPASSSIPAGFSFTSIAILDALKMFSGPIIELHISNIHKREAHYHHSYVRRSRPQSSPGWGRAAMPSRFVRLPTCLRRHRRRQGR